MKTWSTPGPFRWEGNHYHYRYVNPGMRPYQKPHPPVWIPGLLSKNTVEWCARNRIPYVMLATRLEPTRKSFEYYNEVARECGYEAGTQHRGYLFKVHVDETEELAWQTARKFLEGPPNIFLEGSRGKVNPILQNLPGMTSRTELLPTREVFELSWSRGRQDVDRDITRAIAPPVLSGLPVKPPETDEERATRDAQYQRATRHDGDHHRHAGVGVAEDPPRARDAASRPHLLLGWRRRDDPRRRHAQHSPHGPRGDPRSARDGHRIRVVRQLRDRPGHQLAAVDPAGTVVPGRSEPAHAR